MKLCSSICASHRALRLLRRENPKWRYVEVRTCKYLNNIVEEDHRAIKRRCASMKGFNLFTNAPIKIAGIELAHRIHKDMSNRLGAEFYVNVPQMHRNDRNLRELRSLAQQGEENFSPHSAKHAMVIWPYLHSVPFRITCTARGSVKRSHRVNKIPQLPDYLPCG